MHKILCNSILELIHKQINKRINYLSTMKSAKPRRKARKRAPEAENATAVQLLPDIEDIEDADTINKWEPSNWNVILENIRQMRNDANVKAPVDTMGCHKCADDNADEKTQRYQKLLALMLSSQTKDEVTFNAMQRLIKNGLSPQKMVEIKTSELEELLKPVSFYKNKAKYIQKTSEILLNKYDGDIPNNVKELVALPGVGPKMAHICMATAWDEVTGIGVDVHVHRIANRLKWVQKPTKEPEQTRQALESWLPRDLWREVNALLVGFGQTICTPQRPRCADCLNSDICPSADRSVKKKKIAEEANKNTEKTETSVSAVIKKAEFKKKKMQM